MIPKIIFILFSFILLVYLCLPGPASINDFPPLPNSVKSKLAGDTVQVPNVAGYFSNNYRNFATTYYKNAYKNKTVFPFPPFRLNHPPEFAYTAIKDQTHSTYLEEYYYPLRGSLFINGLEPFNEDGTAKYNGSTQFKLDDGQLFDTKVTIRFYPSSLWERLVVWLGIDLSIIFLWILYRRIYKV